MKTNSNLYTIIYSAVLVLIVAFLLAFTFKALEPKQNANVALDKKKQILYSLNIRNLSDAQAEDIYNKVIEADEVIDENNHVVEAGKAGGTEAGFALNSSDQKAGKLALFICNVDGQRKYVIPVYGTGLWGGISGYIAVNDDKATVYGAYFNHESETAGLGAEIKDNQKWQEKFQGKHLFKDGDTKDIALSVNKKVEDPTTQVDAVTGATLTSNGVSDMLHSCLAKYINFLNDK